MNIADSHYADVALLSLIETRGQNQAYHLAQKFGLSKEDAKSRVNCLAETCRLLDGFSVLRILGPNDIYLHTHDRVARVDAEFLNSCHPDWKEKIEKKISCFFS